MGYDVNNFVPPINEELVCPICLGVYDTPTMIIDCQHIYCLACIQGVVNNRCPECRVIYHPSSLIRSPRNIINMVNDLKMYCTFKFLGCMGIIKLENLGRHVDLCVFNPENQPKECSGGCGAFLCRNDARMHNCIAHLKGLLEESKRKAEKDIQHVQREVDLLKKEIESIKFQSMQYEPDLNEFFD